jgi:hypothetical protein
VQVLVTRTPEHAHRLTHFSWGLLILTAEKGKATEMSYLDARSLVTFLRGLILIFMFDYDTKEKKHKKTRQSD